MSFIGNIPSFCSFRREEIEVLATTSFMKRDLSSQEIESGLVFKGPFVVSHPVYAYLLCIDLQFVEQDRVVGFYDGEKIFQFQVSSMVEFNGEELIFCYLRGSEGEAKVRIRGLTEHDVAKVAKEKGASLEKFAAQLYRYFQQDPMAGNLPCPWVWPADEKDTLYESGKRLGG